MRDQSPLGAAGQQRQAKQHYALQGWKRISNNYFGILDLKEIKSQTITISIRTDLKQTTWDPTADQERMQLMIHHQIGC
ncbi:hypothetical protein FGO68_gene5275 [Halteria grandinella]|uniref:Uncharacterized protein n=1 Tax=Halteria grandinella TaxID=5974 RepID=A0A8J8NZT4_HALGN|nr:hypothetical protein FGO68_gene5275 [Halteria grandinella]